MVLIDAPPPHPVDDPPRPRSAGHTSSSAHSPPVTLAPCSRTRRKSPPRRPLSCRQSLSDKALAYLIEEIGVEPGEVAEVPLGSSRVGGLPDLPKGAEWPAGPGGIPYAFIAQIRHRSAVSGTPPSSAAA
ncbi:DUF1963 domain-containing protein [Corynebacterium auris]|uniref:DUF1963 domain-containing protein n=1 Tax=Corynebacterium auris TaxID=44750 RepID=UPI00338F0FDC